jgi:hypothetical protein
MSGENSRTPSSSPVQLAMVEGMVTVATLSESAKILSRYARRTAPASPSGGGDLGPFQRAAGLGEDANCPLRIDLRSGDRISKM